MAGREIQPLSDEALRKVFDLQPMGLAVSRPLEGGKDYLYVYANAAFDAINPGIQGRTYLDQWPGDPFGLLPAFTRVMETGEPWSGQDEEIVIRRGNGELETIHIAYWNGRIDIGGEPHLLTVLRETTGEVRARRDAEGSRWRLETIFENMGDAFLAIDGAWRVTYLNDRAAEYLGLDKRASIGRTLWELAPSAQGTVYEREFRRAMRTREAVSFEAYYPPADMWTEIRVYPGDEGIAAFITDVTMRKRAEEEHRRALQQAAELKSLEDKDRAIRQAYSDVIDAVTGGRLVILGGDEISGAMVQPSSGPFEIREGADLSGARVTVREMAGDLLGIDDMLLAFSEAATNMLKHAGGGIYRVAKDGGKLQLVLVDEGPGINFRDLPKATLVPGFSTKQTLGMGFSLMMELADRLLLCTGKTGTTLVLESDLAGSRRHKDASAEQAVLAG